MGKFVNPWVLAAALAAGLVSIEGDAAEPRAHQLQLGLGFSAPFNLEEPYIDLAKSRAAGWRFQTKSEGRLEGAAAINAGFLDPVTFMPTKKSAAANHAAVAVFLSGAENFRDYYADTYVLDWKGDARGAMQRWEGKVRTDRRKNSVTYSLEPSQAIGGEMRFTAIGDGFGDIRLYRAKNAKLLEEGEIWNPELLNYVRRYDIVRTMDIQSTNNSQVRRFDQIATMDESWGQRSSLTWPEPPFFSAPYEILFDLGVKADVAIWLTIPPQLGAPISVADPSLRRADKPARLDFGKFTDAVARNAKETMASPEWEIFAREFVDRYLASGYPQDRPLYIEVGNEIWNLTGSFAFSSNYAIGLARGLKSDWRIGHGYGALTARTMVALEREFASRKIAPNVTYVIGSHTANIWRTKQAVEGTAEYLQQLGADPKRLMPKTGVAVTNYYGQFNPIGAALFGSDKPAVYAPLWIEAIRKDPADLARRLSDHLKKGPATEKLTGPWIEARWDEHKKLAESAGSRFLGGYEGGSHLIPPKELASSKVFLDWWTDYHWGDDGAEVARSINQRLIKSFPGVVIANYESIGEIGPNAPWIDGHYAKPTPMLEMWDEFARAAAGARPTD